jgi:hypothetical protein
MFIRQLFDQTGLFITMADYPENRCYISIMTIPQATANRWLQMLGESLTPRGLLCDSSILKLTASFSFNSS